MARHKWYVPPCSVKGTKWWIEQNFDKFEGKLKHFDGKEDEDATEPENPEVCEREGLRQTDGVLRPAPGSKAVRHRKGD